MSAVERGSKAAAASTLAIAKQMLTDLANWKTTEVNGCFKVEKLRALCEAVLEAKDVAVALDIETKGHVTEGANWLDKHAGEK